MDAGRFTPRELLVPLYNHNTGVSVFERDADDELDLLIGGDERRMIEPRRREHLIVVQQEDTVQSKSGGKSTPTRRRPIRRNRLSALGL